MTMWKGLNFMRSEVTETSKNMGSNYGAALTYHVTEKRSTAGGSQSPRLSVPTLSEAHGHPLPEL